MFVCHYINSSFGKSFIADKKVGGAQPNFGAKQLEKMPIAIPEMGKQEEFKKFVEHVDNSKLAICLMKGRTHIIKASLIQKYFDGRL